MCQMLSFKGTQVDGPFFQNVQCSSRGSALVIIPCHSRTGVRWCFPRKLSIAPKRVPSKDENQHVLVKDMGVFFFGERPFSLMLKQSQKKSATILGVRLLKKDRLIWRTRRWLTQQFVRTRARETHPSTGSSPAWSSSAAAGRGTWRLFRRGAHLFAVQCLKRAVAVAQFVWLHRPRLWYVHLCEPQRL